MHLVAHVEEGTLPKFEVIHCLGTLSGEDDHAETVGESPNGQLNRRLLTMGPNQRIAQSLYPDRSHYHGSSLGHPGS